MYRIVAQSFPNNEIRVTWSSLPHPKEPKSDVLFSDYIPDPGIGPNFQDTEEKSSPPLSLVPNSQSKREDAGFGRLPDKPPAFGLNAKRNLIRRGAAMEGTAPSEECLFLTGTLPGSTEDSFRAIAEWSSYIVHRLKSWVGTYARSKLDFYCWEYQRRGALHLHYCVWLPDAVSRSHIHRGFHGWWVGILHAIGEKSGCDMFRKNSTKTHLGDTSKVRAVAEVCRKSPARYLAKYLSKSASPVRGAARAFSPARWWGTSRPLKTLCDSLTQTVEIIEGGYHRIRVLWEQIFHVCDSSDSVTYSYRHKVGSGHTLVSYPNTPDERTWLLENLKSYSPMAIMQSDLQSVHPFETLKTVKLQQMRFYSQLSERLRDTQPGLATALNTALSWITALTPSTSPVPLSNCLSWMAYTADIAYLFQSSLGLPHGTMKQMNEWLNTMDTEINRLADMEVESRTAIARLNKEQI